MKFTKIIIATISLLFLATVAKSEDDVKLRLNWMYYGSHAGFAHGFVVLSETADFIYKCTDYYHPESEQGIAWDDPDLNIDWSIADIAEKISLSDKDKQNVKLKDQPAEKLPAYKDFMTEVEMRAES